MQFFMKNKLTVLSIPILFILPWISYLISLINLKSRISAFIFIFFAGFFGYSIGFTNTSVDSYRYAEAFMRFERPDSYLSIIQMYLDGELRDIYRNSLFYIVSFFSRSANVVYALAGLIYGSLAYLSLRIYIYERGSQTNRYTLVLALIFITYCSLSNINAFNFNTAALLAFCSTYNLIIKNKKIWLIGIFLTPLMHYSFALFIPVILILKLGMPFTYNSVKVNTIVFYVFIVTFILSFFLSTNLFDISFISRLDILPGGITNRIDYVNSDDVSEIVENRVGNSLFLKVLSYFNNLISFYVLIVVLYINKYIKNNNTGGFVEINMLFTFVLLYYSFAHIAISFPSGSRFMAIGHMFLVLLLSRFYRIYNTDKIKRLIFIALLPFMFNILFINIVMPIMILTPTFWYGGFVGVLLENLGSIKG